jgi:hypothetical protein
MSKKKIFLLNNEDHVNETHNRWINRVANRNREPKSQEYKDNWEKWILQQCFNCQFFVPLKGGFSTDWGVCTNPYSPLDAHLMFEHDGCEHHSPASDEEL